MERGARNLLILGVGAIVIATTTTAVSLAIYRISGDIYLDRSRPGYLPDKDEVTDDPSSNPSFVFSESGALKPDELDAYLEQLRQADERLKNYPDPFSPLPLSDESLNIPSELPEV